jgi:hypothetical protein
MNSDQKLAHESRADQETFEESENSSTLFVERESEISLLKCV